MPAPILNSGYAYAKLPNFQWHNWNPASLQYTNIPIWRPPTPPLPQEPPKDETPPPPPPADEGDESAEEAPAATEGKSIVTLL